MYGSSAAAKAARVMARTREIVEEEEEEKSPKRSSVRSRNVKSERITVNDREVDMSDIMEKIKTRTSLRDVEPRDYPKPPQSPRPSHKSPRQQPAISPKLSPKNSYKEIISPRSPQIQNKIDVTEIRDITRITYDPDPPERKVTPEMSYRDFKQSTREELQGEMMNMNSEQLRNLLLKMKSEKSSIRESRRISVREKPAPSKKIPVFDPETSTWILYDEETLMSRPPPSPQSPPNERKVQIQPPLIRRGTTRDAYPTRTLDMDNQITHQSTMIDAVNPDNAVAEIDIDFDAMSPIQVREFLDEMKIKFSILKKNYPDFPVPVIKEDDNPKWVFGIYEQLLDMAKGDASQPMYQSGMQLVFLIVQVVLTLVGIPAKDFFSFHSKHFRKYNQLMVELGEKWGPLIDVTSSVETKLMIAIGWNTLVFAIVSVIANKFGDKIGGTVEQLLEKITSGNTAPEFDPMRANLEGHEEMKNPRQEPAGDTSGLGGIANMLGGLLGGGGSGGGLGSLLGGLLNPQQTTAQAKERKLPVYEDD